MDVFWLYLTKELTSFWLFCPFPGAVLMFLASSRSLSSSNLKNSQAYAHNPEKIKRICCQKSFQWTWILSHNSSIDDECQTGSKDTPQPKCECYVKSSVLEIRIHQDNPSATLKGSQQGTHTYVVGNCWQGCFIAGAGCWLILGIHQTLESCASRSGWISICTVMNNLSLNKQ